jgi:hypothetical protein
MCCTGLQICEVLSVPQILHSGGGERDRMMRKTKTTTTKTTQDNVLNNCLCTFIGYTAATQQVTCSFVI